MATATPFDPPRAQTAQKQHAGLLELDAQPSVASIRLPERAAPKVSAPVQVRLAHIRTPTRHRAPNQEPGRILIPGDGAAGDQRAQNRPACATIVATRRLRQRFLALWCQAHTPSCSRQVTSTSRSAWSNQARLALLTVTHRYNRTPCLWLEQFQIADSARSSRIPAGYVTSTQIHSFCATAAGHRRSVAVHRQLGGQG
jgi:hypothetical protein